MTEGTGLTIDPLNPVPIKGAENTVVVVVVVAVDEKTEKLLY